MSISPFNIWEWVKTPERELEWGTESSMSYFTAQIKNKIHFSKYL
jgi:hypothetical protein